MILISGNDQTSNRLRPLAYSSPEPVQTTGTVAEILTQPADDASERKRAAPMVGNRFR
jgi:hypothetical protein